MIQSKKQWVVKRPDEAFVEAIQERCQLPAIHAKILASRDFESVDAICDFLSIDEKEPHDPFYMYGMDEAVMMIDAAVEEGKKITVYGDYDADGVTSTSLLYRTLEEMGANVDYAIPNRFIHGYGPNKELFDELIDGGTELIITVDNGISAIDEIRHAKERGCAVILTDHHEIGEEMPPADVILHPRHPEGDYPFGELAGVGVALKLSQALVHDTLEPFVAYAAIGTIADLVPLVGENRWIVRRGLEAIRAGALPAIEAFAELKSIHVRDIQEETVGFQIGPQLNAPGRLGEASLAVKGLIASTKDDARPIFEEMTRINEERKELVETAFQEALTMIDENDVPSGIVVAKEGWNPGVVGIVASRIVEEFHRPTIVLAIDEEAGVAKGSARSIPNFHLFNQLTEMSPLIAQFGGHEMAAGLTVSLEQLETFQVRFNERAEEQLTEEDFIPKVVVDVPVTLEEITVEHLESLDDLRPFGVGFEQPVYYIEDVQAINIRQIGSEKQHLKFQLKDGQEQLDVIGFNEGNIANEMTDELRCSVIGELGVNEWNGNKNPQLIVRDIKSDEWQLFDYRGIRKVRRWAHLIPENAAWLAFREETMNVWKPNIEATTLYRDFAVEDYRGKALVLIDLPHSFDELATLIYQMQPSRIYAHFYMPQSYYYEGIPSRDDFSKLYRTLQRKNPFYLQADRAVVLRHFRWSEDHFNFMLGVFFDLQFVTIEGDVVSLQPATKKQLSEAKTYQERERLIQLEETLVYDPSYKLKQLFQTYYEGDERKED